MNSQWRWETVVSSPGARDERSASVDEEIGQLSARHLDVLGLIADGLANKEIATALGITSSGGIKQDPGRDNGCHAPVRCDFADST